MNPRVSIIMGSTSDLAIMEKRRKYWMTWVFHLK